MPRRTTTLALLQSFIILMGFLALSAMFKLCGYPEAPFHDRWNPLALFLREHWFLVLLLPVICTAYTVAAERIDRGFFSEQPAFIAGISLTVLLVVLYLYAFSHPFTRDSIL